MGDVGVGVGALQSVSNDSLDVRFALSVQPVVEEDNVMQQFL